MTGTKRKNVGEKKEKKNRERECEKQRRKRNFRDKDGKTIKREIN